MPLYFSLTQVEGSDGFTQKRYEKMRVAGFIFAAVGSFISSCSINDPYQLYRGVGTELYTTDVDTRMSKLESYSNRLCLVAGLSAVTPDNKSYCNYNGFGPTQWDDFVDAGMNDIDQRCDQYLQWLDLIKRSREPISKQIGATRQLTGQVLEFTRATVPVITVVGNAFDYANSSFLNLQSSLLLELDHTTVQSVVYGVQNRLRTELERRRHGPYEINSKPEALRVLRTYLRSCMPMAISTEVNNQLSALAQGMKPPETLTNSPGKI